MAELNREQKKDYAKKLFLTEKGITQKEIAHRTGVTEATVCRWIAAENWETQRVSLLMTKDEQLSMMYQQLNAEKNKEMPNNRTYLKYYEGETIVVIAKVVKGELEVHSWFSLNPKAENDYRRGMLIKKATLK